MATRTRAQVTPADFERLVRDLSTNILVERDMEMRLLTRGTLAGVNTHFIGEPGVAKSLALREFCKRIVGARYFEKLVHGLMPADAIIGAYDMAEFARTGDFHRKLDGYLPRAHFGFLDEIPRANGPLLDAILPMMNTQERAAEHNGGMIETDLRAMVTASNTWFDPENQQAQAISDRVTLMLMVEDVKADDSFKELMRRDHARRIAKGANTYTPETITIEQFIDAQAQVAAVSLTPEFLDALAKLRREAKQEGLRISPRRWVELVLVTRANGWMAGRDHVIPEDLAITEHGLWRDPDDAKLAHKLVMPFHGRFEREAAKFRQEAAKALVDFEKIRPEVEGTPPQDEIEQDIMTAAVKVGRVIDAVKDRVDGVLAEAEKEKRDAASLRELSNELLAVQEWFLENTLPTKLGRNK